MLALVGQSYKSNKGGLVARKIWSELILNFCFSGLRWNALHDLDYSHTEGSHFTALLFDPALQL